MTQKSIPRTANKRKQAAEPDTGDKWTIVQQNRLEELFDDGSLCSTDSASKVKESDVVFHKYSNNVIGYHLGMLRKKLFSFPPGVPSTSTRPVHDVLRQFRVVPTNSATTPKLTSDKVEEIAGIPGIYELLCENMPFLRFSYMKYDTKQEKIVVLLDLPGGSGDYDWEFNELGDGITIVINWSKALYDVTNLFKVHLEAKVLSLDHPKLHAMQTEVLKQGYSAKQIPRSRIVVDLGKRVQKDDDTWEISIIQHEGNKILEFEFSGFQEEVLKKEKRGSFA